MKYVLGKHTFDNYGFVDGTMYFPGPAPVMHWDGELSRAMVFDDTVAAQEMLDWLREKVAAGENMADVEIWAMAPKRIFEARLKG